MKKEEPTEKEDLSSNETQNEVAQSQQKTEEKRTDKDSNKEPKPILPEAEENGKEVSIKDVQGLKTRRVSILEVCGLIIAALAFFVSIWQTYETRHHNRLSVTPKIVIWVAPDDVSKSLYVEIENTGIGPAVIQSVEIIIDDTKFIRVDDTNLGKFWEEVFDELEVDNAVRQYTYHSIVGKDVFIPANDKLDFLSLEGDNLSIEEYLEFKNKLLDVSIRINYCSVYQDCYENFVDVEEYYSENVQN